MVEKKRLLEFAGLVKGFGIHWTCQLRPTKEFDLETMKTLKRAGLDMIVWGVESGCDRILRLMRKGTNKKDIAKVLNDSHEAGIKNACFVILGFPTETKDEFVETMAFLKDCSESIDLVLTSVFGLQRGSFVFEHPEEFKITKILTEERTVLEPSIRYEVSEGLTNDQANVFRRRYKRTIDKLNKYPKEMNFFREHMLYLASES
jgi:radical SAM superfamily enzyme YgiQ (UPF0313 family)